MKIVSLKKSKIAVVLILSLLLSSETFAGQFVTEDGVRKYIDDDGVYAVGWKWIDINNDNIAECYRFNLDGSLATKSTVNGKNVNNKGQWVVDGIVQRINRATGKPLYAENAALGENDTNEYFDLGTYSSARRLNATKNKNIREMIEADLKKDEEGYRKSLIGPNGEFEPPKEGYLLSRGIKELNRKAPVATISSWGMIDDMMKEDEIRYLSATESIVAGRDMRRFVSSSNKYTASAKNVKIYGGDIWDDVIMLQGNGASVKFLTTTSNKSKKITYQANYLSLEVAHQTHGEATADTYCAIEIYLNGQSIGAFDDFCDGKPEFIEMSLDDDEKTVEIKAIVTGDAPGRKIYIRNAMFKKLRTSGDDDD